MKVKSRRRKPRWNGQRNRPLTADEVELAIRNAAQRARHTQQKAAVRDSSAELPFADDFAEFGGLAYEEADDPVHKNYTLGRQKQSYRQLLRASADNWRAAVDVLKQLATAHAPLRAFRIRLAQQLFQSTVQSNIDSSSLLHCCASGQLQEVSGKQLVAVRKLRCWGPSGCPCEVSVPSFLCQECSKVQEVSALAVDCFPSSPQRAGAWFHTELLEMYHSLHMAGVTDTAFCNAVNSKNRAQFSLQSEGPCPVDLDDRSFGTAYRMYRVIARHLLEPESHGAADFRPGVMGFCAACSEVPDQPEAAVGGAEHVLADLRAELDHVMAERFRVAKEIQHLTSELGVASLEEQANDGNPTFSIQMEESLDGLEEFSWGEQVDEQVTYDANVAQGSVDTVIGEESPSPVQGAERRPFMLTGDGCMKASHYAKAGTVASEVGGEPYLDKFFGEANRTARLMVSEPRQTRRPPEEVAECTANLRAARFHANKVGAVTDEKCIIGLTCTHTVPVMNGFISAPTPEQFLYYDVLLKRVLQERQIGLFMLDTNCQYKAHFLNAMDEFGLPNTIEEFRIGWMHSKAGHNLKCQLAFSGLFADGMGRCIGENDELLWAYLKWILPASRYMSLQRRIETIDDALYAWALEKENNLHVLLKQAKSLTVARIAQLHKEMHSLLAQAQSLGVELECGHPFSLESNSVQLDKHMEYVKLMEEKTALSNMTCEGGGYIAALDRSTARHLVARVQDAAHQDRLESQILRLERELGITVRWTRDSTEYQEHAERLRLAQLDAVHIEVEKELSWLATLQDMRRQEGVAGQNTRRMQGQLNAARKKLRELMAVWAAWTSFMQDMPQSSPMYDEDAILAGELPWQAYSGGQGPNTEHLRLKLFRVEAELKRSQEELRYLAGDAWNCMKVYAYQQAVLLEAIVQKREALSNIGMASPHLLIGQLHVLGAKLHESMLRAQRARATFVSSQLLR